MNKVLGTTIFVCGLLIGMVLAPPELAGKPVQEPYNETEKIDFNGSFTYRGHLYNFTELEGDTIGLTNREWIKIEPGRNAEDIDETCNHELLHNWFPKFSHGDTVLWNDPIYRLADEVDTSRCNIVTQAAIEGRNPYLVEAELIAKQKDF